MTLPTLQEQEGAGAGFMRGLAMGTAKSIPELIGGYQHSKQMKSAADYLGLKDQQRDAFLGLPSEIQEKVLPGLISEANKRKSMREKIPIGAANYLKNFHPDLHKIESVRGKIAKSAQKYFDEGLGETDSYDRAIQDYLGSKGKGEEEGASSSQETNPAMQALFGPIGSSLFNPKQGQENPRLQHGELKTIPSTKKTMARELPTAAAQLIENATPLGALLPLAQQKGVGLTPRELLGKEAQAGTEKYFGKPSEYLKKKLRGNLSPEELQSAEATAAAEEAMLSLGLPSLINKLLGMRGPKAISPDEILPAERAMIEQKPGQIEGTAHKELTHKPSVSKPKSNVPEATSALTEKQMAIAENTIHNAKRFGIPISENGTLKLYHGTRSGHLIRKSGKLMKFPFFTTSESEALQYAHSAHGNGKPEVLQVELQPQEINLGGGGENSTYATSVDESIPLRMAEKESSAPSLEKRITKAPETPTEMRMKRLKPEAKIYPRLENIKLREIQLKNHPKYVQEIEQDAAERAARTEAREPKTIVGRQSQQLRMHEAEKNWPLAQESYNRAAGRVRALENEVAKLTGQAREEAETVLELAKKNLDDAVFDLKNAYENLTGVNVRAGVDEMRNAARKKLLDIQDTIANGEEYKLSGRDYSPKLIEKADAISKSKKLPSARQSDFYTQVHDVYVNEYKNRLDQIAKEIKELPKSLAGLSRARQLEQEKDIINKMIKSADAEKTIQNRRFALREMSERHKAQERFNKLERAEAKPEVSEVARQKIWKERIQEAKTPEQRARAIDEGIEEIVAEHPEQAEKIRAEGKKLKETVEDLFKAREPQTPPSAKGEKTTFREPHKKPPPPPKKPKEPIPTKEEIEGAATPSDAVRKAKTKWESQMDQLRDLKSSFPHIWKSKLGQDMIMGTALAWYDEWKRANEIPVAGWQVAALIGVRRRSAGTSIAHAITKWAIRSWKVANASRALKKEDTEKFSSYSPSIQKRAKETVYSH